MFFFSPVATPRYIGFLRKVSFLPIALEGYVFPFSVQSGRRMRLGVIGGKERGRGFIAIAYFIQYLFSGGISSRLSRLTDGGSNLYYGS